MLEITLSTPNGEYTGWESVRVNLALDQMAGAFELTVSGENARTLISHPLKKGMQCRVKLGSDTVITGYIDTRAVAYDADTHTLTIAGRDLTCDLVDCSAIVTNQELHNVTIAEAAAQLIAPFPAISLNCPAPGKPFAKFVISDGATIYDVIADYAKQRGLMVYTLGDGVLRIRKPEITHTTKSLIEGLNIKSANTEDSDTDRFGRYIMRYHDPDSAFHKGKFTHIDNEIRAERVRIIQAEKADKDSPTNRAEWEAKLRKARSEATTITVQGWHQAGELWRIGQAVKVQSPALGINDTRTINAITYTADDDGTLAELEMVKPEIYSYA